MASPVWFASESGGNALWALSESSGGPAISTVTPTADGCIFTHTGGGTHYRVYLLGGSPGSWVSLGASPVTLTGLTANTEYTLEISGDGSTVADTENFGTLNEGGGGGGMPTYADITAAAGASTSSTLTGKATFRAAITAAAGVATASTLAGKSTARAAATPAAGTATTGTLSSDGSRASITPAAGTSTTSALAGKSTARASIVPASGSSTAGALVPVGAAPPPPAPAPTPGSSGGGYSPATKSPLARRLKLEQERREAEEAEVLDIIMALAAAGVLD